MLVEVVVGFFAGIQFVRWRYRRGRVFLFLDLINSLNIPQVYFALRYTILGEDSTIMSIPFLNAHIFYGRFYFIELPKSISVVHIEMLNCSETSKCLF